MLSLRLVAGTASEDAYTLLRFIQKQIDEYGSHNGKLASPRQMALALAIPEQTATSKEISNPFMAVSLDLSILATTLNRLERSIQIGINTFKQGRRINDINEDEDITLVNVQDDADNEIVKPKVKGDVIEEPSVPVSAASALTKVSATITTTATIPTLRKGIVITVLGRPTITRSSQQPSQAKVQDKGKEKMIEPEKPLKKKDLIRLQRRKMKPMFP
ncbi:hypothetical protein Tco_0386790 [Tanacetum coccineum]